MLLRFVSHGDSVIDDQDDQDDVMNGRNREDADDERADQNRSEAALDDLRMGDLPSSIEGESVRRGAELGVIDAPGDRGIR